MDNMKSRQYLDREELVRRLGLRVTEAVLREVVQTLLEKKPLYSLHRHGTKRDGSSPDTYLRQGDCLQDQDPL